MERCCENCIHGQKETCEESNCWSPSLNEFKAKDEYCSECGTELKSDSIDIEFVGEVMWLECPNCGEMYDLDGNIIKED